jgi:hypothetical protein
MRRRVLLTAVFAGAFAAALVGADGGLKETARPADINTGLAFVQYGVSAAEDVDGGVYLGIMASRFLSDAVVVDAVYCAEIAPLAFQDHVVAVDLMFLVATSHSHGIGTALGPVYFKDLNAGWQGNYLGVKVIPATTWKYDHRVRPDATIDFLPLSVLYGIDSKDILFVFALIDLRVFF